MEVFAVDKLAGREEAVPIEADATLSALKRQCGEAFGFGDDVELSVGGQRVACDDGEAVSSIAAFSGGCRVEVERGVREFVEQLRNGETTMDDIPLWARMRRECAAGRYCCAPKGVKKKPGSKKAVFRLHWLPPSLYDDKEVMQPVVQTRPECLYLASPALRRDVDVALASLKWRGSLPVHFPNREMCLGDKAFVLDALEQEKIAFKEISPTLRDDKDVVMMAMGHGFCDNHLKYRELSTALRGDKEVALKAIGSGGVQFEFQCMSEELRGDKDVVLEALPQYANDAVQHMSEELRVDKGLALKALANGASLQHMSEALRGDNDVALKAIEQDWEASIHVADVLRNDRDFASRAVTENSTCFRTLPDALRDDVQVALIAICDDPSNFAYAGDHVRGDRQAALAAFAEKSTTALLAFASADLQAGREVGLQAMRANPKNVSYASPALQPAL